MKRFTRRTPPLLMGVVALALMLSIFPSAFHSPVGAPGAIAEFAPVATSPQQSGTVGAGGEAGSVGAGSASAPPVPSPTGSTTVPYAHECVGSPARQTEDPLSPPCVARWDGFNGGATAKGVTGDAVTLVITDPTYGTDRVDYAAGGGATDTPYDATARLLVRYFQFRFETYRRTVHVYHLRTASEATAEQYDPFGVIPLWKSGPGYLGAAGQNGTLVFGGATRPADDLIDRSLLGPDDWWFEPDLQSQAAAYANYVCAGLVGSDALMAGPAYQHLQRSFAIVQGNRDYPYDPEPAVASALQARCGLQPITVQEFGSAGADATEVAQLQTHGVTTVLLASQPLMEAAGAYLPEWVWLGGQMQEQYPPQQQESAEWSHAFGLETRWRWLGAPQPYYYEAALGQNPRANVDTWMGSSLYDALLMAFTAIQMAGPELSASHVRSALERFTAAYAPPFSPHAGFAPGKHAFLDDYMIVRWDPTATAQGAAPATGCGRLADGGRRYLLDGPWPDTDRAAVASGQPCQPDEVLVNAQAADER